MTDDRIDALRRALAVAPDDHALRLMLAEALAASGDTAAACRTYAELLAADRLAGPALLAAGRLAAATSEPSLLEAVLAAARRTGLVVGLGELEVAYARLQRERGVVPLLVRRDAAVEPPASDRGPGDGRRAEVDRSVTFSDVGGLDDVKKTIHRMIILPFQRPELYARYGRKAGGGVMLYGPPGCGKTLLARATAGECGLPFVNIRIEDVLDPYLGVSERNLHDAFEEARARRPCVVFLDELDGLAYARGKHHGGAGRALVDQLLQELDAMGADNRELLVLGATNAPWDVDDGLARPGRFDRLVFVPPPDEAARAAILEVVLRGRPSRDLDVARLARDTALHSGADLRALVERAVDEVIDEVIDEALGGGAEPPLAMTHLERARAGQRPSTLEWLSRARNYVEFANQTERYADVARFLRTREAKALRAWQD